jgi:gliding motility-associated-like protein
MIQRFLPLFILCLLAFATYGQNPLVPGFDYFDPHPNEGPQTRVCSNTTWDAGTSNQSLELSAQSNDVEFLCFNDILEIDHNGDFNLDIAEDPIPATPAGICYVFYDCAPTSTGPDLTNINSDPCNDFTPAAPGPGFLYLVGNPNINTVGDGSFQNNGGLQTFFNGGDPVEIFFAPVTVGDHQDALSGAPEFEASTNTDDFCINVTISDAFRVVYLNEIATSNINNNVGDVCTASFDINGGLSEFDVLNGGTSNYTINIVQNGDPTITGTVTSGGATHGSTVTFTVPSAGTYDVTVEDGKSCGAVFSVDMSACIAAVPFSATYTSTDITCNGADNGILVVDLTSGTPGFTFDWQLQPAGAVQSGTLATGTQFTVSTLAPGTYDITVTDNDGDQDISTFTIIEPGALGANLTNIVQPSCNGGTGSISVEIFEGGVLIIPDASYTFTWTGTTQTTQTITNVLAGGYAVTVTNGDGCTAPASGTLSQPSAVSAPPITGTDASCIGIADGSATIVAAGGIGILTYNWDTTPAQITATATNLEPGTYNVTVEDQNGCTYTDGITIGATTVLTASAAATDITCNGANDGSITITPAVVGVDNGGYAFTWTPNVGIGATLNSLGVNTYTILVTDTNGCTATAQEDIAEPTALNINTNVTHESCNIGNDGSITTSVSGGTPLATGDYNYIWSNIEITSDITGLSGDTYTVTVTDANACTATATEVINSPNGPTIISAIPTNVSCATSTNGAITVTALPGNDPIATYEWSTTPIQTMTTATDLSPGVYTVTVTDTGGCGVTTTATVDAPPILVEAIPAVTTTPLCLGDGDGTITLNIGGGVEPYNYDWSNGSTGPAFNTLTNLIAGTYTVTVIDANLCELAISGIVVLDPPAINVLFQNIQPVSCFGAVSPNCDGEATVSASGGLSTTYTFTWDNGETSTGLSSTAFQLCQGNHAVTVTDMAGCTEEFNMTDFGLEIPAPPVVGIADIITEDVSCFGDIDGTATILPTGGDGGPYNIVWSNGQIGDTATGLAPTQYTVSITDGLGCESVPFTITVGEPQPLQLEITDTIDISCSGEANGSIQVAPIGGNAADGLSTYEWTPNTTNTLNTAVQLSTGTYGVTVTDIKGCTATNEALIEEPTPIYFEYTHGEPLCFGLATVFGIDSISGGGGEPYIYTIDGFNFQSSNQAAPVLAGDYTIAITDNSGCEITEELTITQPAEIIVALGPDVEIQLGESYEIIPTITPLGALDVLTWDPVIWLSCDTCFNPTAAPLDDQVYTLLVTDSDGCFGSDDIFIDVDPNRNVFIPNAFTPNEDGHNDFFAPYIGPGVENIKSIYVFDRRGEVVYFTQNFVPDGIGNNGWDGTLGGKFMNTSVFVYIIEVAFTDGQSRTYKGDVTLLR